SPPEYAGPTGWTLPIGARRYRVFDGQAVSGNLACEADGNHSNAITAKLRGLPEGAILQFGDVIVWSSDTYGNRRYPILSEAVVDSSGEAKVVILVGVVPFDAQDGDPIQIVRPLIEGTGGEAAVAIPVTYGPAPWVANRLTSQPIT